MAGLDSADVRCVRVTLQHQRLGSCKLPARVETMDVGTRKKVAR